jgi:hypothetical protein
VYTIYNNFFKFCLLEHQGLSKVTLELLLLGQTHNPLTGPDLFPAQSMHSPVFRLQVAHEM